MNTFYEADAAENLEEMFLTYKMLSIASAFALIITISSLCISQVHVIVYFLSTIHSTTLCYITSHDQAVLKTKRYINIVFQ